VKNEARVSILSTLIQYSTWIINKHNKASKRNKTDTNTKGGSQIIPICRWYDPILNRIIFYTQIKTLKSDEHFQQGAKYKNHTHK
jgi:hypothetical protein